MLSFCKEPCTATKFIINKADLYLVHDPEEINTVVTYDPIHHGYINVKEQDGAVYIRTIADTWPSIFINLDPNKENILKLDQGFVKLNYSFPRLQINVGLGTIEACLDPSHIGLVKARINSGVLLNNSALQLEHNENNAGEYEEKITLLGQAGAGECNFHVESGMISLD